MTIKIQPPNIFDRILSLIGKKRAVYISQKTGSQKYGTYLAPRENFFRCLFRKDNAPLSSGWTYPDDLS
jgi:hypothetical protein